MSDSLYDMLERAAWTAIQAFLAAWVIGDIGTLKPALIAAAAAAVSVVKEYAKRRLAARQVRKGIRRR